MEDKKYFWHGRFFSENQINALKENNFRNIPTDKLKAISSKGGKVSAEKKRRVKAMKERASQILNDQLFYEGYTEEFLKDFAEFRKKKYHESTAGKN